ncbi:baseplate J/gp47 family protein [Pseudochelatococcus sp. G4_1912]|uniref:baseplate assembly protein n=1 Tax=Pseudochelatococcus sp. G4_1912 TaxID=3114288 RepID=UPI0039C6DF90
MSRFEDIDLARLGDVPDLFPPDYEAEVAAITQNIIARWEAMRLKKPSLPSVDTLFLEGTSTVALIEEVAYRMTLVKQHYNDAVRAVMLASTWGAYLEQRAAEFGLTRRVITPGNPQAVPPVPDVMETDEDLRRRRQMAVEAISTAGPYGAYIWWALEAHPQIKSVAVYGPESGLVDPGEVLVMVLDKRGDGVAPQPVLDAVTSKLSAATVRPLTDRPVFVESAAIIAYDVVVTLTVLPGPDNELVRQRALARITAHVADRHKVGAAVTVSGIAAAASVVDEQGRALVEAVAITSPLANVVPGPKEAAFAQSVTVTTEILDDIVI